MSSFCFDLYFPSQWSWLGTNDGEQLGESCKFALCNFDSVLIVSNGGCALTKSYCTLPTDVILQARCRDYTALACRDIICYRFICVKAIHVQKELSITESTTLQVNSLHELQRHVPTSLLAMRRLVAELKAKEVAVLVCSCRIEDQCLNEAALHSIVVVSTSVSFSFSLCLTTSYQFVSNYLGRLCPA